VVYKIIVHINHGINEALWEGFDSIFKMIFIFFCCLSTGYEENHRVSVIVKLFNVMLSHLSRSQFRLALHSEKCAKLMIVAKIAIKYNRSVIKSGSVVVISHNCKCILRFAHFTEEIVNPGSD